MNLQPTFAQVLGSRSQEGKVGEYFVGDRPGPVREVKFVVTVTYILLLFYAVLNDLAIWRPGTYSGPSCEKS